MKNLNVKISAYSKCKTKFNVYFLKSKFKPEKLQKIHKIVPNQTKTFPSPSQLNSTLLKADLGLKINLSIKTI